MKLTPSPPLDLFPITHKELKHAHYQIAAETKEGRERVARQFRMSQPGICAYLPYTSPTIRTLAYENALICSFARHLCAAFENRCGVTQAVKLEDLLACEVRAKALLRGRRSVERVRKIGAVQFVEGGILGVHYFDGIRVIPDARKVLLKVVTLLICFNNAIRRAPITHSINQESITGDNPLLGRNQCAAN